MDYEKFTQFFTGEVSANSGTRYNRNFKFKAFTGGSWYSFSIIKKQAELELLAAKLDVNIARAAFYPSFNISASLGFQAFNSSYLVKLPESLFLH